MSKVLGTDSGGKKNLMIGTRTEDLVLSISRQISGFFVLVQIKNKPNRLFLRDWRTPLNFTGTTKARL